MMELDRLLDWIGKAQICVLRNVDENRGRQGMSAG